MTGYVELNLVGDPSANVAVAKVFIPYGFSGSITTGPGVESTVVIVGDIPSFDGFSDPMKG